MNILAIDTATEGCSAALLAGGAAFTRELETAARGHAENILPMIDALLKEGGVALSELDAIAFGRGPGAFTGLRLAASVTQGLAFAAQRPVVAVSDLAAVAQRVLDLDAQVQQVLVCNDARMQEVYWGCFERGPNGLASLVGTERVSPQDQVVLPKAWTRPPAGGGRGFRIYPQLKAHVGSLNEDLLPRAIEIARLAVPEVEAGRVTAPEHAIPVYLRDEVAKPSSSA